MSFYFKGLIFFIAGFFIQSVSAGGEGAIQPFKSSWVAKTLALQRQIDLNAPFIQATFIGTHNSYNSKSYQIPFVRYVDPNHTLSVYDQLELGVRSIEFDAHWYLGRYARKEILLCHGLDNHLGCSVFDRPFVEGLQELTSWLLQNPDEIVLLYIERHLDGHEPQLAVLLEQYVGSFLFKPSMVHNNNLFPGSCKAIPEKLTKADILKAGKQLLIVTKNCDNYSVGTWNDIVFAGIGETPLSPFSIQDTSIDENFKPYPDCGTSVLFPDDPDHHSLWRVFEDRTKLSHPTGGGRRILATDMIELMRCKINWPAFDMLSLDDERLAAAIWSWAPGYPMPDHGQCAIYKLDKGIENVSCDEVYQGFTCQLQGSETFTSVATPGVWQAGEAVCQAVAGKDWHFAMPLNGGHLDRLKNSLAVAGLPSVWLNYHENSAGKWTVGLN